MEYNIVTNYKINQIFRQKSKYYKINLGQAITIESRTGDRELNTNDKFAFTYNVYYKTGILRQGSIGDITFYTDHFINDDVVRLYIGVEEFIHKINFRKLEEIGIDGFIGDILKKSKEEYDLMMEESKENGDSESESNGVSEKVILNPGAVTYEDLKAYMENQKQINKF
jgi:hypothetical protein